MHKINWFLPTHINLCVIVLIATVACTTPAQHSDSQVQAEQPKAAAIIYYSTDAGNSWVPFSKGIAAEATVSAFKISDNILYASTDQHGIYSIREGGTQWQRVDQDLPEGTDINDIATLGENFIAATFADGILLSKNKGANWMHPAENSNVPVRALHVKNEIVIAGTDQGIYQSLDKGESWQQIYKGVQVNGFAELHGHVYAALSNGALLSRDNGHTWQYIYKPHALHDISTDGKYIFAMTLGAGLLKTDDDGTTWQNVNEGLGTRYTFEVKQFDNTLFAAQWIGLYTSDNGGASWQRITQGLPDSTAFTTLEKISTGLIAGIGLRKK